MKNTLKLLKVKLFLFSLLLIGNIAVLGQQNGMQNVIPPSPDAASLGKFQQYPVAMYNGLVQVDIPIYTIKTSRIEIPISISYHPSGVKIDEISSNIGLGWVLNGGGVITRSVRGLPDDRFGVMNTIYDKTFVNSISDNSTRINFLWNKYFNEKIGTYDSESDVYYYNVGGMSGSFRYDIKGNIIQIPKTNNIIKFESTLDKFTIIRNDGTIFVFDQTEKSRQGGRNGANVSNPLFTSSWYLSSIITTNKQEISFDYFTDLNVYTEYSESSQIQMLNNEACLESWEQGVLSRLISFVQLEKTQILRSISFPSGKVSFVLSGDRKDRRKYKVIKVLVSDNNNKTVKGVTFKQSYFTPFGIKNSDEISTDENYSQHYDYRLKLDEVGLYDNTQRVICSYFLDYNTSALLPRYNDNISSGNRSTLTYYGQDVWGYYNGITTNTNFLTCYPSDFSGQPVPNRSPNPFYAQACILKKITYPTGGYDEFEYEGNKRNSGEIVGGLRIKSVVTYDSDRNSLIRKYYEYDNVFDNYIWDSYTPCSVYTQSQEIQDQYGHSFLAYDYFTSNPEIPLSYNNGCPVFYSKVTEYEGSKDNNIGKAVYFFNYGGRNTEYLVPIPPESLPPFFKPKFYFTNINREWKGGQLSCKRVYSKRNGVYKLIKSTINKYEGFKYESFNVGFSSFSDYSPLHDEGWYKWGDETSMHAPYSPPFTSQALFQYFDLPAETGIKLLTQTQDSTYSDSGAICTTKNYFYTQIDHQFNVSEENLTKSDGSTLNTTFKYPYDFTNLSDFNLYNEMVEQNILTPIIEKIESTESQFLTSYKTNYMRWGSFFVPNTEYTKVGNIDECRIRYHSYDNLGNITSISKENDFNTSYLWAYNQTYPVVKADNVTYDILKSAIDAAGASNVETFWNGFQNISTDATQQTAWKSFNSALRSNPTLVNAQLTTYTYNPLVGMTSKTDPNGITTYYEYDSFGRLKNVKDHEGNILKQTQYHYQKQP
jgi:YD repeat-containing protein